MKKIIENLEKRGLVMTANNIKAELRSDQIDIEFLKTNKNKLTAFANKLSATSNPLFLNHSKKILDLIQNI